MKPFVLKQHVKDAAAVEALRVEEIEAVGGGGQRLQDAKLNTITVTPSGNSDDGSDDG